MKCLDIFLCAGMCGFLFLIVVGCETTSVAQQPGEKPFGTPKEVSRAEALWKEMRGYQSWSPYPGLAGFQDGKSPHGRYLKYYVNGIAIKNPSNPGDGAILVKENFMAQNNEALAAVTVMKKIRGYDPDNGDWFWVKFDPQGNVMKNPMGMSLAGRVMKGSDKGCIACHANAGGGDFLFVNDE